MNQSLSLLKSASIILLFLLSFRAVAIVNMDSLHFAQKKDTFKANIDFRLSGSAGNTDTAKAGLNAQFSWHTGQAIHLAILGYQYGESNRATNINKAFVHYRYIHQLNNGLDAELFTQLENNEFTRLSYRGLLGAGLRLSLSASEQHHAFAGVGAFYSREEISASSGLTDAGIEVLNRANLYFLSKYRVSRTVSLSNVLYYQPRLGQAADFRALYKGKLDFKINRRFSLRLSLDIEHDSQPSQSIKPTDISYLTGVVYSF